MLAGCSTAKNTSRSRWWHAFNARYNTYYNGTLAYIDGSLQKEQGNKDNFTEMIPLYTVGNKDSREIGKSDFDRAILKCQKAIKLHSIKRKPEWNKSRRKTARDIEWLNRKEYNPFLWKAWMLMGRSQFYEGDFDGAASTFAYMSRLYETQPAIYARARAWLAKSYVENSFLYDAEDVIRNMQRDSIPWRAQKEWNNTLADYYIHTNEYEKAIPYLRKMIKSEMRRKQKAREWFLMGQICQSLGRSRDAYKAYQHCIRLNPPYELEFNARIAQTEVLASGQSGKMVKKLRRMAHSDKNVDYLDQVYYAIGNIYLAQKDTVNAISAYEQGNKKATRSGIEKGVLLLKLGDLYWDTEKFGDAQRCYGEAIGLLDKERPDYEQLSNRSKVLDELVPYTDAVHLQDSLQELTHMDEAHRNAAIDRVIENLKKKEKEEQKAKDEQNAQQSISQNQGNGNRQQANNRQTTPVARNNQQTSTWYFYNPTAVQRGKQQFQQLWGKRENVDDWQRVNKTVVAGMNPQGGMEELTDEQRDSLFAAQAHEDSLQQISDSAQNDPHKREYYLKQLPFSEEDIEASNAIIMDGLYNSGVIFKDKLDNLPLSEKALRRLADHYPTYEHMDDAFYHLFLLYSREGKPQIAEQYVDSLKARFPESQWTTLLTDPNFVQNSRNGVQIEDSLYGATYDAFKADRYNEVRANAKLSEERFPMGANRDKFMFIGALGKLNDGDPDACLKDLNELVEKFPTSKLSEMAGMIINGVKAGRKLRGGKFDIGDVWTRRSVEITDSAKMSKKELSNERNTPFTFMLVYVPDSVNENKLLYQLARFNFTSFLVRDFDIAIDDDGDVHRMRVSGFRSYDEALQYARQLLQQKQVVALAAKARPVIISDENLPLLGSVYSYDDYSKFYNKHFAPLSISTFNLLTEPAEVVTEPEPSSTTTSSEQDEQYNEVDVDNYLNDNFIGNDEPNAPAGNTTVVPDNTTVVPDNTTTVPDNTTVVPDNTTTVPDNTTIVTDDTPPVVKPITAKPVQEPAKKPVDVVPAQRNQQPTSTTPTSDKAGKAAGDNSRTPVRQVTRTPVPIATQPQNAGNNYENEQPIQAGGVDIVIDDDELPTATKPTTTTSKPSTTTSKPQPTTMQPANGQQSKAQNGKNQQAKPQSTKTQPAKTQPAKAQPTKAQPKKTEPKKEEKKPVVYDLDDEYYDLDGF